MLLYIDPGTGSMLFTLLIGIFGTAVYAFKVFWMKISGFFGVKKFEKSKIKTPIVFYSDDKRYWNIFEPICKELDKLNIDILYLTGSEDDPVFKENFVNIKSKCIGRKNSSFFELNYLNANLVISTTPGLDVYQWKRSKNVDCYIHILHAAGDVTMYRMFGIDYYDAILLSGQYQYDDIRKLEKLRNLPEKELVKIGIPYMDEMYKRLKSTPPLENHNKTILLAPSWGKNAILSIFGEQIIEELIKTDYDIIIRPHPQSFISEKEIIENLMAKYPETDKLKWNRDVDNFECLRNSDLLISDFSGVIHDFALIYNKPVIYTNPEIDISAYDAWWLNEPIWTITVLNRIGKQLTKENISNLKSVIDECIDDTTFIERMAEIKNETWEHFGEGTQNAVNFIVNKLNVINAEKEEEKNKLLTKKKKFKIKKSRTLVANDNEQQ